MLGFLVSIIAFSLTAYSLNRYLDSLELDVTMPRKLVVLVLATLISMAAGSLMDKMDGDADKARGNVSIVDAMQKGDPALLARLLVGIN